VPANFVSLQYGYTREEVEKLSKDHGIELNSIDDIDLYNDIDGLAALISACDIVISIDNLTVHLAGALGVDTKVLLPMVPDVRWGKAGSDSYWYDHLTLYRQDKKGAWEKPVEDLIADITR
jgi:ADP-heptose:LPS heptosyltransferase